MSTADSRICDGVFIPVRSIDSLQPQRSAFFFKGRPGRRYSVKVDVFRLPMSVFTANGATRHFAVPVLKRCQLRSQNKVPMSVSVPSKPGNAPLRRAVCAIVADVDDKKKNPRRRKAAFKTLGKKGVCICFLKGQ